MKTEKEKIFIRYSMKTGKNSIKELIYCPV